MLERGEGARLQRRPAYQSYSADPIGKLPSPRAINLIADPSEVNGLGVSRRPHSHATGCDRVYPPHRMQRYSVTRSGTSGRVK